MYSKVKTLLDRLGDDADAKIEYSQEDTRLAVAVLYYRVIVVDGQVRPEEMEQYRTILSSSLDVSEDELELFEKTVIEHFKNETSLFPFTSIIRKLPSERRREIFKHMQAISISDRELHEFEINFLERVAELLGLKGDLS
ncbi:MAG: TerB family tellurite resistance protein [Nitratireductor sp.]